jgi:alpha-N-arabinofuranosidase
VVQLFKSTAEQKNMELLAKAPLKVPAANVLLRISAEGDTYSFRFSENGKAWTLLKDKVDARFLSTQEAGGFIGCLFGMYGTSAGKPTSNTASFKWLKYEGHDPMYKKAAVNPQ